MMPLDIPLRLCCSNGLLKRHAPAAGEANDHLAMIARPVSEVGHRSLPVGCAENRKHVLAYTHGFERHTECIQLLGRLVTSEDESL